MKDDILRRKRLIGLDLLRALAVLGVVAFHIYGGSFGRNDLKWAGLFPDFHSSPSLTFSIFFFTRIGSAGVILFFVLSGYCIQLSVSTASKLDVFQFYWRRFWRIYPPYLISLLFFSVLFRVGKFDFITHLAFLHSLHEWTFFSINPSFWSLSLEFHLYLIFPLFHFFLSRVGALKTGFIVSLVTAFFHHLLSPLFGKVYDPIMVHNLPFAFWVFWGSGAWLADLHMKGKVLFRRRSTILLAGIPFLFLTVYVQPMNILRWWIFSFYFLALIEAAVKKEWELNPLVKLFAWTGTISYSIYLWHQPLIKKITPRLINFFNFSSRPLVFCIFALAAFILFIVPMSFLSYRFTELPASQIGRRPATFPWKRANKAGEGTRS